MRKSFESLLSALRLTTSGKKGLHHIIIISALVIFILSLGAGCTGNRNDSGFSVLRSTLKNGLRVIIVENDLAPVVTTEINYLVGSNETSEDFPGTAHALEHMMFRGSEGLSADQLADISAAMGGNFNADTRETVTQYYFTVPSDQLDLALHIESIRMKNLLSTDTLWTNERGAIEQEVARDLSNPQYVVYTKLLKALYKGTPFAHDGLGTRPSFDKTTGAMLKEFHDTWYAPNNAILVISGKVNPADALNKVKKLFGDIPEKKLPERPAADFQPVKPDTLSSETDLPYGLVFISFRTPGTSNKDFPAIRILTDVLSSQRGNLYGLVPQGKALYAGFDLSGSSETGLGMAVGVFQKGADPKKLTGEIQGVLNDYMQKGFPDDLVEAAKRHEISDAEFQNNSISGLANAWSEAVAVDDKESPQAEIDEMKSVTTSDVNRVAKKYLTLDHAVFAYLTPQESGQPVSQSSFGGSESFAPKNPKEVDLPDWAEKAMGRLSVPESNVKPTVYTTKNGIRLIIQPENISNTVSLYGSIKNNPDLQVAEGKEGVSSILNQLFEYGSDTLDRIAFQKALDDIGANESAGTGFSLQVLSKDFDKGVALLADNLLHPALPENAFKIVRSQTAGTLAGELQSPDYLAGRALTKALVPENDPTLRQATPETVNKLILEDVKNYYDSVFRPDMTTIVVMGNVDPEIAILEVEKYFSRWQSEGSKPETELSSIALNQPSTLVVPDRSRVQDNVSLAENLAITRADSDRYALQLGNNVLGGSFYATRLYKDLRENSGLVYYVSSSFSIGKHRARYSVNYGCDPPNVSKARAIIVRDLKQMQTEAVPEKEFNKAKSIAIRDIQLSESSVGSIAHGLLARSLNDLPLDEPTITARHYIDLTSDQVMHAYSKWLNTDKFVQVTEGPAPE